MVQRRGNRVKIIHSERQLEALGERFAREALRRYGLRPTAIVFALEGDLGAGKTTFLRGFARGLGIKRRITSPTFVLARRYRLPSRKPYAVGRKAKTLQRYSVTALQPTYFWHIDAYRLRGARELSSIEYAEIVHDPQNIVAIEWADRIKAAVPKRATWIQFRHHPKGRTVTFRSGKLHRNS